jgi:tetratricopeptide (TPR) repeat protein
MDEFINLNEKSNNKMTKFDPDTKPPQDIIRFIESYMEHTGMMMAMHAHVTADQDLIRSTAFKMAKDIGNLEDCNSRSEGDRLIEHFMGLLRGWLAHGWIADPSKLVKEGYFDSENHACPNCGWKNASKPGKPALNGITSCVQCRTGLIQAEGEWTTINAYLDPEGYYFRVLFAEKTPEITQLRADQEKFLKNAVNMTKPLGYHDYVQKWRKCALQCSQQKKADLGTIATIEALNLDPLNSDLWRELIFLGVNSGFPEIGYQATQIILRYRPDDFSVTRSARIILLNPELREYLLEVGIQLAFDYDYCRALAHLRTGLKLGYDDYPYNYGMGYTLFNLKRELDAKRYLEKAYNNPSKDPRYELYQFSVVLKLGIIHTRNNDRQQGIKFLKEALAFHPEDDVSQHWLGIAKNHQITFPPLTKEKKNTISQGPYRLMKVGGKYLTIKRE